MYELSVHVPHPRYHWVLLFRAVSIETLREARSIQQDLLKLYPRANVGIMRKHEERYTIVS